MRKITAVILSLCLVLCLCGCGGSEGGGSSAPEKGGEVPEERAVKYISNRKGSYSDENAAFYLFFSLLDQNKEYMDEPADVAITITNADDQEVYSGVKSITAADYLENTDENGNTVHLAAVVIPYAELAEGSSSSGVLKYTVAREGAFRFDEYSLNINDKLPVAASSISQELKDFLDSYEAFMDQYCEFMKNYDSSDLSALTNYLSLMQQYSDFAAKADVWGDRDMTDAETIYYIEVLNRIEVKMLEAVQGM